MSITIPEKDESTSWNPLNTFWNIIHPIFCPTVPLSPEIYSTPPLWDLPSAHGKIHHPYNNPNAVPHYVHPSYFTKLTTPPSFPVIHNNPEGI
jgi:hypothetical protein